jgi:SAM-dependent methyltransferase
MFDRFQDHWYKHAAQFVLGKTVLDAGAGTGSGLQHYRAGGAALVEGFELVPLVDSVRVARIEDYADASWDIVSAMDVIEHVDDDVAFFAHLLRVAREAVFLSTPNWNVYHAGNIYHAREYTPAELDALTAGHERCLWISDEALEIKERTQFDPVEMGLNFAVLVWK